MLDILKFIFSSFWIWLGSTLTLVLALEGVAGIISCIVKKSEVKEVEEDGE